jgi:hypothetical protein
MAGFGPPFFSPFYIALQSAATLAVSVRTLLWPHRQCQPTMGGGDNCVVLLHFIFLTLLTENVWVCFDVAS